MNSVKDKMELTIHYNSDELIEGKWLSLNLVTKKINEEATDVAEAKARMYRSCYAKKYNTETIFGMRCINIIDPMKCKSAALILYFEESNE